VGVLGFLRAHLDTLIAVVLVGAFMVEAYLAADPVVGAPMTAELELEETVILGMVVVFLSSLALRTRLPLIPLALGLVALVAIGRAGDQPLYSLLAGLLLAAYSAGAWAGRRAGRIGALGVGLLAGMVILRAFEGTFEVRVHGLPALLPLGAWLLGLAVRTLRAARGDERVVGELDWEAGVAVPDSAGRDETVRELRDVIERAMSAVILQARNARRSLHTDTGAAERSLLVVETAGTEALEETQRLTGLLLSPDGAPLPEPQPGLADLDFLAEELTREGLPVDMRVEGRPLPLTPDLDAVAYRVVHEALMATLHGATDAQSSVVVRYEPDELQVEVVDDGVAAPGDASQETAGLVDVRKEVAAMGGTLEAGPAEGRGYWVLARLPYEPDWSS
jgi:signal transduction histidine kinase